MYLLVAPSQKPNNTLDSRAGTSERTKQTRVSLTAITPNLIEKEIKTADLSVFVFPTAFTHVHLITMMIKPAACKYVPSHGGRQVVFGADILL